MQQEARIRYILDALDQQEFVSVQSLVDRLEVSPMTVRRDLAQLEGGGYLVRRYGGALKSEAIERLFSFTRRLDRNGEQKEAICRKAADFLADGEVVFVDCGTTLFRLCRPIVQRKSLRVITNSLPVVSELIHHGHIRVTLIGGEVVGERQAVYGAAAERAIGEYHADAAFIGADGLSLETGLSSYDEKEAGVTRAMAEHAERVYLLADSSKIERDSYYRFAPLSLFDVLITDSRLEATLARRYRRQEIQIINAPA